MPIGREPSTRPGGVDAGSRRARRAAIVAAMNRTVALLAVLGVLVSGVAAGCTPRQDNPPPQMPPPGGWPPPTATAPPPMGTVPPNTMPPPGVVSSSATPLDPNATGAAAAAITVDAKVDAPGMAPEGNAIAGQFQEGQTLEQPVTINPGKCYTFIAAGVGAQEIEVQLVAQTPIPAFQPIMGDQSGTGGKVVLGRSPSCIKLAIITIPIPAKWVIKAKRGGGVIAGQGFSK
jgi:hypothetical protein